MAVGTVQERWQVAQVYSISPLIKQVAREISLFVITGAAAPVTLLGQSLYVHTTLLAAARAVGISESSITSVSSSAGMRRALFLFIFIVAFPPVGRFAESRSLQSMQESL
jgi:hypothetical protein